MPRSPHHLTSAFLRAVLDGRFTPEAAVHSLCRSLAGHCDECARALADALESRATPPSVDDVAAEPEDLDAEVYLDLLASQSVRERPGFLAAARIPRATVRPLVLLVFNEVRHHLTTTRELATAGHWLDTAFAILEDGPPELLALAYAHRGNLARVAGYLRDAEIPHLTARAIIGPLSEAHPEVTAEIVNLRGSYYLDLRSLERAKEAFATALEWALRAGSGSEIAKALIQLAHVYWASGDYRTAVLVGYQAVRATRPDSRLALIARFNLIHQLLDAGQVDDARQHLLDVAPDLPDAWQPRVLWLEGRLTAAEGRDADAEVLLRETRRLFADAPLDAALVDLDLAQLLLRQGRWSEIRSLLAAVWALPVEVPSHILTAYRVLNDAVTARALTLTQLRGVYASVRDWRDRPRVARAH